MAEKSYEGLARRYRPQNFADVIGQRHVVGTLTKAIESGRWASSYLFIGGRGLGKTTMARLLAKAINCVTGPTAKFCGTCASCIEITAGRDIDVLEIDAASNTGVDNVRDSIIQAVATAPARGRAKIFIIDEVHMLSGAAFNALLKTIEEPPPNVIFILATTEGHKVPATIRSRCQRFDFRPVAIEELSARLRKIVDAEKITIDGQTLALICDYADGGVRDALSALDLIRAYSADTITIELAEEALGVVSSRTIEAMMERIAAADSKGVLEMVTAAINAGVDPAEILRGLLNAFRTELITDVAGKGQTPSSGRKSFSRGRIVSSLEALLEAMNRSRQGRHPRIELEVLVTELAEKKTEELSLIDLYQRLSQDEKSAPMEVPSAETNLERLKRIFKAEVVS